jgi:hypothetical protein
MISDMYTHRSGPRENSKKTIKSSKNITEKAPQIGLFSNVLLFSLYYPFNLRATPRPKSEKAIAKLKIQRRGRLPYFLNKMMVGRTETQLTIPTKAVIIVAFKSIEPLRIVLE